MKILCMQAWQPDLLPIELAETSDLPAVMRHLIVHSRQSGQGTIPHHSLERELNAEMVEQSLRARWARSLSEPLWSRTWCLWTGPRISHRAAVVGHVELRGGRMAAELHRCVLAIGIQPEHVCKGHGPRMIETAIAWARAQHSLAWIDLGVFSENVRARRVYERVGFRSTGRLEDAFRLDDGASVDDVQMTLRLKRPAVRPPTIT